MGTTTLHVIQDETGKHKVILPDDRHFKVKAEVPGERSPIDTMPKPALAMYEESLTAGEKTTYYPLVSGLRYTKCPWPARPCTSSYR